MAGDLGLFGDVTIAAGATSNGRLIVGGDPVAGNYVGNRDYNDGRYTRNTTSETITGFWNFNTVTGTRTQFAASLNVPALGGFGTVSAVFGNDGTLWIDTSDETLKENIVPSHYGLSEIYCLWDTKAVISYNWRDAARGTQTEVGFSAQRTAPIIPEAAPLGADGTYGFNDRPIIAALVNAVGELSAKCEALEERVAKMGG